MHSRWLFALGIGTGLLFSGLAAGPLRGAFGAAPIPEQRAEPASAAAASEASGAPSKLKSRHGAARTASGVGAAESIVTRLPDLPLPEEDDEDNSQEEAGRRALDDEFRRASIEARDEAWAGAMERSLQGALEKVLVAAPVAVGKPDCRTQHCVFDIEWLDRDTALTAASDVLDMLPDDCARTITHADAEQDEYDTYKSRVLLDCPRPAELQR